MNDPAPPGPAVPPGIAKGAVVVDRSRLRSFIGLSIGLVGPRANLAVSGVLITLFVEHRASSALAVTFALTAHRLLTWMTYPVSGRLSDRTVSRVGRRTPYMGASLVALGISTWMFTVVKGYWLLVLCIVVARQAAAVFTLTNVAVVPEVFGRSRWLKALLLTTALGTVASLAIKATVLASWKQSDPATWDLPFRLAAIVLVAVGLVVLALVREAPAARAGAAADRHARARPAREELRRILAGPNAKVLVAGSLLFWSGVGSTAYVAILFFQQVLHAGAGAQTVAGLAVGVPAFLIGLGLGIPLSRLLTRRQLAVGAPLVGALVTGVQYFDTHLWQAVVLSYLGAPFFGAYVIALAPLLLHLLPRSGGLGERLGTVLAPFNLCSVLLAYAAAAVVDATGNLRLIWLFPAATGIAQAALNTRLVLPPLRSRRHDPVARLWAWAVDQTERVADDGVVRGLLAAPLLGQVTSEDADSAVVVDLARQILGNPYEDEDEDVSDAPGRDEGAPAGPADAGPADAGPADAGPDGGDPASARGSDGTGDGAGPEGRPGAGRQGGPDSGVAPVGTGPPAGGAAPGGPTPGSGRTPTASTRPPNPGTASKATTVPTGTVRVPSVIAVQWNP